MKKSEKRKILQWILENHQHHYGCENYELLSNTYSKDKSKCIDGNKPYVNSIEFENFIKNLKEE